MWLRTSFAFVTAPHAHLFLSLAPLLISKILPKIYCSRFLLREALCDDRWDPVKKWLFKPLHQLTRLLNKQSCCYGWQKNCFGVMVFAARRRCLIGSSHTGQLVSRMFTATDLWQQDCLLTLQVSDLIKRQPLANHIMSVPSDSSQTNHWPLHSCISYVRRKCTASCQ